MIAEGSGLTAKRDDTAYGSPPSRGRQERSAALELERDLDLGAIGFDPAFGVELHIELHDFGDAKVAKRLAGPVDRHLGGLFPGILAGADQFDDLVNAITHNVLPLRVRQDARCSRRAQSLTSPFPCRKAQSGPGTGENCWDSALPAPPKTDQRK